MPARYHSPTPRSNSFTGSPAHRHTGYTGTPAHRHTGTPAHRLTGSPAHPLTGHPSPVTSLSIPKRSFVIPRATPYISSPSWTVPVSPIELPM